MTPQTAWHGIGIGLGLGIGGMRDDLLSPLAGTSGETSIAASYRSRAESTTFDIDALLSFGSLSFGDGLFAGSGIHGQLSASYLWRTGLLDEPISLWLGPTLRAMIDYDDATTGIYNPTFIITPWIGPDLRLRYTLQRTTLDAALSLPLIAYIVRPKYTVVDDEMLNDITSIFWSGDAASVVSFPMTELAFDLRHRIGGNGVVEFSYAFAYYSYGEPRPVRRYRNRVMIGYEVGL